LIVLIGLGLLVGGTLPSAHLHHSTGAHPQVVHSHFESALGSAHDHHDAPEVGDDDHENAVDIAHVIAGGPRPPWSGQPAVLSARLRLPALCFTLAALPRPEPSATPSPPAPSLAPRAPPA